jgi:hypothetical protein
LEEAIRIQKSLDPIPAIHASGPDKAKKKTTPWHSLPTPDSGNDYQGGSSRPKPKGNAPRNDTSGGRSAKLGQRRHKRSYSTKSMGSLTKPLPPLPILLKEGERRGESQVTPPLPCRSIVGGRLQDFWDTWCPKDSPISGTYSTRSSPGFRLATAYNLGSQSTASSSASAVRAEIKSLQDKGAIVPINNPGPGFYSHIFVVPKKQKGFWRLIINLSRLNRFLRVPHFKMDTTRSVAAVILPGD